MSGLLGKLFGTGAGGKGGGKGPSPQEAIQRLRDTEEMLSKKQEFLEKKIEQELAAARKHGTKNKRAALQALKRKKRYEKQLAQIDGTLSTIEFQREALENANTNTEVLKNMGFAAKAMKAAHDNMDIDKVDELMQDIAEQQELADEISTAISKPVGFGEEFDEDELMAELEELEQEELDKNLLEISGPETVPLPNVPSISIPSKPAKKKEEEEDDDMKELEAWAGTISGNCIAVFCIAWKKFYLYPLTAVCQPCVCHHNDVVTVPILIGENDLQLIHTLLEWPSPFPPSLPWLQAFSSAGHLSVCSAGRILRPRFRALSEVFLPCLCYGNLVTSSSVTSELWPRVSLAGSPLGAKEGWIQMGLGLAPVTLLPSL
ncbi:hypothetical protein IHE44_0004760, partial [Lamprotornis superbus]